MKVLISGSGIAGSAFARCLLVAHPTAQITIVERAPALRLTGAAVDVRNAAVDVIKWMGVEPEIRAQGTRESGVQLVDGKGAPIMTLEATGRSDVQTFSSEYDIMRAALAKILIKPLLKSDKISLLFNETVKSYESTLDGQVQVTLANSGKTDIYDLLVAADGFGSRIRGQLFDTPSRDQAHDLGVHVCYFTVKEDLLRGSTIAKTYIASGGRCVLVRPDPDSSGRCTCLLMNITRKSQTDAKKRLNDAIEEGHAAYKKLMHETYADVGWMTPHLLKSMDTADDFYCSLFGRVRCPTLSNGSNVVLLGDAGYATPGIGTSFAITGSYILAGELMNHPTDLALALKNYEHLMQPYLKEYEQDPPDFLHRFFPQSEWGVTVRDSILRFIAFTRLDKLLVWASTASASSSNKMIPLPHYEWPVQTQ